MSNEPKTLSEVLVDEKLPGLPERFQPRNLTELMSWAKLWVSSGLAPKAMNEAGIVIAVQMGAEINVTPTQAVQNIAIINGRPCIWGDLGLALFRRDARFTSFEERAPDKTEAAGGGWCKIVMQHGAVVEREFTIAMARTAKLWEKRGKEGQDTPWITYPGRMLQMRARWWAMRDAAPGVFKGLAAREEQEDIINAEVTEIRTIQQPQSKSGAGVDPKAVAEFTKDVKPAQTTGNGGAPATAAVDRSKLQKVLVKDVQAKSYTDKKTKTTKAFYCVVAETSLGKTEEASSFSETLFETAKKLKGNFALAAWHKNERGYLNLDHIEPAVQEPPKPEAEPPIDEPGASG